MRCPTCGSTDGYLYREGQPEHPDWNPWICQRIDEHIGDLIREACAPTPVPMLHSPQDGRR